MKKKRIKNVSLNELPFCLRRDRRLVFLHGTFDLFHRGHAAFLEESKKLGAILVVGVDHDDNVALYKQKLKPVYNQEYRVHIISRLDFVDYVIPLPKLSKNDSLDYHYLKLYLRIKPDVVAYGVNFDFSAEVNEKCRLIGAEGKRIKHPWSHLTTSGYINDISKFGTQTYGANNY